MTSKQIWVLDIFWQNVISSKVERSIDEFKVSELHSPGLKWSSVSKGILPSTRDSYTKLRKLAFQKTGLCSS
jgi:hypothetical protein